MENFVLIINHTTIGLLNYSIKIENDDGISFPDFTNDSYYSSSINGIEETKLEFYTS